MKIIKITLLICFFTLFTKAQTVHTVDNRQESGAQFTDLQNAIDAASAGDIIHIHPSATNYGNITIAKQLKLVGLGHDPITHTQTLAALVNFISLQQNSGNTIITGLTITNGIVTSGTNSNRDDIQIIHNKISSLSGTGDNWIIEGNYITSTLSCITSSSTGWIIKNNFLLGAVKSLQVSSIVTNNIFLSTSSSTTDTFISNCIFTNISNNIFIATNANMTSIGIISSPNISMRANLTYNFAGGTITDLPEDDPMNPSNINNTDPNFVNVPLGSEDDFYNNDYHLTNPILGTDATTNIGIHGLNFAFDHQGRPDLQPYPIDVIINNNIIAPGQPLSVRFTAAQKQ